MSVLKNKRSVSDLEYDRSFKKLYYHTMDKLDRLPRRRQQALSTPFIKILKETYRIILDVENNYADNKTGKAKKRYKNFKQIISNLQSLELPLFTYWNIVNGLKYPDHVSSITDKKKKSWIELINKEIDVVQGCIKKSKFYNEETDGEFEHVMYYKNSDLTTAKFLGSMSTLQRVTHTYVMRMSSILKQTDGELLLELVNEAWYHCVKGNYVPETSEAYAKRRKHFSKAISCLYSMNEPLIKVFNVMRLSDSQMRDYSCLLNRTKQMLLNLQSSDKQRFSDLT